MTPWRHNPVSLMGPEMVFWLTSGLILHCLKATCQKRWYNSLQQDERNFISPCCFPTTQARKLGRDEGPQQKNALNFFNQQNEVSGPKQFLSYCLSARSTFMRPRVNLLTYIHLEKHYSLQREAPIEKCRLQQIPQRAISYNRLPPRFSVLFIWSFDMGQICLRITKS